MSLIKKAFFNGDIEICFLEVGVGSLIVCQHGFPDNANSFIPIMEKIASAGYKVVSPYLRGYFPTSAPLDNNFFLTSMVDDIETVISYLGYDSAIIIGSDWGAQVAVGAAILYPEKVERVITIGFSKPTKSISGCYDYLKGIWHCHFFQKKEADEIVSRDDFQFLDKWWSDACPNWSIPTAFVDSVKQTFRSGDTLSSSLEQYRCRENLSALSGEERNRYRKIMDSKVTVPVLAIHGDSDRLMRLEAFNCGAMNNFFVGELKKVLLKGAGHFPHLEKTEEFTQIVMEYLMETIQSN